MIRVLVVEDEPTVAEAHRVFVERVDGFEVVDVVGNAEDALTILRAQPVDVILLDLGLPGISGLDLCQLIRRAAMRVDVIAVTSARELDVVRSAVELGIVQYLVKPFTVAMLHEKLERYADYHATVRAAAGPLAQHEVDAMLTTLRGTSTNTLPKGLSVATLQQVIDVLRGTEGQPSASEVGEAMGTSRVTASRYLQHLVDIGMVEREAVYGSPGRPSHRYRLLRHAR